MHPHRRRHHQPAAVIKQFLASFQQANDANGQRRSQRAVITLIRPQSPQWRPDLIKRPAAVRGRGAGPNSQREGELMKEALCC